MPFSLTQADADKIDQSIAKIYPKLGGGELSQLAKLFKGGFSTGLMQVLRPHVVSNPGLTRSVDVSIAWIDKGPYALMTGETSRVELADTAVFYFDVVRWPGGTHIRESRCLLLQAKAAKTDAQIGAPSVCINPPNPSPGTTTQRELRLLSTWPEFDMYASSSPKEANPRVAGLKVTTQQSRTPPPHGWFMGTPRSNPNAAQKAAWRSAWMCAPAKPSHSCNETLGSLLARHLSGGQMPNEPQRSVAAGEPFAFTSGDLSAPVPSCTGWDRVCIEILRAVDGRDIPPHLTGGAATERRQSTTLHSLPIVPAVRMLFQEIADLISLYRHKRMPVLIVSQIADEVMNSGNRR
jgi:hypothetical protein